MKTLLALFFGVAFWGMSGCTQKVDIEAEKVKVKSVVDQFEQVWETEDMELLSKIMAHDADMVNYGSDAAEHFVGWEALKEAVEKMFPSLENTKITVKDQVIKVHPSGNVAWFSEVWDWDLVIEGKPVHSEGQRFTGVLEKRNGQWVFVQFHNSVPVAATE
ncbi:MAG: nuclear transport factor 2 family protein [Candidatus Latescibacteria bacterium]|nr:nuclear transport factor 2 family protein [Candidatus Latescibacterota bacterium]